jgi:hypothetical protein
MLKLLHTMMILPLFVVLCFSTGCVSWFDDPAKAPDLDQEMSVNDLLYNGIKYGRGTFKKAKILIDKKAMWTEANRISSKWILQDTSGWADDQLLNLVNFYQSRRSFLERDIFVKLVHSKRVVAVNAGWQLLANLPDGKFAKTVDQVLSEAIIAGTEAKHQVPPMADAIRMSHVTGAYSFVRAGLYAQGDISFAKAMASLEPGKSSGDFLTYLAMTPVDELRQINQKSLNLYTAVYVLKHFMAFPVSISHSESSSLFYYAVSRNNALSDLGRQVLQFGVRGEIQQTAGLLARLPAWLQMSLVESVRRAPTTKLKVLIAAMGEMTSDQDVAEEVREVIR